MTTVSNSFSALSEGEFRKGKNRKEEKKQVLVEKDDLILPRTPTTFLLPSIKELEKTATLASDPKERLELWRTWKSEITLERRNNRPKYQDEFGKPVYFHTQLENSQAIERSIETCMDTALDEEQGQALLNLLQATFPNTEADILQQLVHGAVKVFLASKGESEDLSRICKKILSNMVSIIKKLNKSKISVNSWNQGKKKNEKRSNNNQQQKGKENRSEIEIALDDVKNTMKEIDEHKNSNFEVGDSLTVSVESCIHELKNLFATAQQQIKEEVFQVSKSKSKKSKNAIKSQGQAAGNTSFSFLDALCKEESACVEEELKISSEIRDLQQRIQSLELQLERVKVSKADIIRRKATITGEAPPPPIANISVSSKDQEEIVSSFESILNTIQSVISSSKPDLQLPSASLFYTSIKKFLSASLEKQEDTEKRITFLVESLQRRKAQEEQMLSLSAIQKKKDLIRDARIKTAEVEEELKKTLFDEGINLNRAEKVMSDFNARQSYVKKNAPELDINELLELSNSILKKHADIKAKAAEKDKKLTQPQNVQKENPSVVKKKVDIQAILREEKAKVEEELALKANNNKPTVDKVSYDIDEELDIDEYKDKVYYIEPISKMQKKSEKFDEVEQPPIHKLRSPHAYDMMSDPVYNVPRTNIYGGDNAYMPYPAYAQVNDGSHQMGAMHPHAYAHHNMHPHTYAHHAPPPPPHYNTQYSPHHITPTYLPPAAVSRPQMQMMNANIYQHYPSPHDTYPQHFAHVHSGPVQRPPPETFKNAQHQYEHSLSNTVIQAPSQPQRQQQQQPVAETQPSYPVQPAIQAPVAAAAAPPPPPPRQTRVGWKKVAQTPEVKDSNANEFPPLMN